MDATTETALGNAVSTGLSQGKSASEIVQMVKDQVAAATQQDKAKYIDILTKAGKR